MIGVALTIVAIAWTLRIGVLSFVSDLTWSQRATYRGSGRKRESRATVVWYEIEEAIPAAVRRLDVDTSRRAIGGHSMGGFGAFDIARLHPHTFCAVGGHSAAMCASAGETPAGAFDDAVDFTAHDIVGEAMDHPAVCEGSRLWLDGGDDDPFRSANKRFADALRAGGPSLASHRWSGGHTRRYWNAHVDGQVRFCADALAACDDDRRPG